MINRWKRLTLQASDGSKTISTKFEETSQLFLAARKDKLSLEAHPSDGSLLYAIFTRKGSKLLGHSVNHAVILPVTDSNRFLPEGSKFSLGLLMFVISSADPCRKSVQARLGNALQNIKNAPLAVKIVFIVSLIALLGLFIAARARETRQTTIPQTMETAKVTEPQPDVTDKIYEAKIYLKEGKISQARLSLIEALAYNPDDIEAQTLLSDVQELENDVEGSSKSASEEKDSEAMALFKDGQYLKAKGDFRESCVKLRKAVMIVSDWKIAPAYAGPLMEANEDCKAKALAQAKPRLEVIKSKIAAPSSNNTGSQTRELLSFRSELKDMKVALPEEDEISTTLKRTESIIRSLADTWYSGAISAESMSGCRKALPIYTEIYAALDGVETATAGRAKDRIRHCTN